MSRHCAGLYCPAVVVVVYLDDMVDGREDDEEEEAAVDVLKRKELPG